MTPHPIYRQIGSLIKERRKQLDFKQATVAARLGISRGSLANIETGRQSILVHQLYKFAEVLQLAPNDLVPVSAMEAPLKHDWSSQLPPGLDPQHRDQIARLLDDAAPTPATRQKGHHGKPSKR